MRAVRTASPRHILQTILSLRPALAVLMVLAVAGPWYVLVGLRTDWQWPAQFFGVHNFGRFLTPMDNHHGPIFYYVGIVLVLFFPWSIMMLGTLSELVRQTARTMRQPAGCDPDRLLDRRLFWLLFALPAPNCPATWCRCIRRWRSPRPCSSNAGSGIPIPSLARWPWIAYSILTLVGLGMVVAVPLVAARLLVDGGALVALTYCRVSLRLDWSAWCR